MDKLGWQSLIFITIVMALLFKYFFQKKTTGKRKVFIKAAPNITIGGWILWTFAATFSTTLMFEQLRTIGVVGILGVLVLTGPLMRRLRRLSSVAAPFFKTVTSVL